MEDEAGRLDVVQDTLPALPSYIHIPYQLPACLSTHAQSIREEGGREGGRD